MSSSKNLEYQKNSFLNKANSAFIESMYLRYIKKDPNLPQSWQKYFKSLNEDIQSIVKEIEGPSWARNINKKLPSDKSEEKFLSNNEDINNPQIQTIKAIALIRAYRIRGHLIANLDPLGMMERKYIHDLHPEDHGFKKEDYNKKIFLGSYMDVGGYSSINEILTKLRKIYCSGIGVEYMHCLLYTSPSPRDLSTSRMPSSA